MKKILTGNHIKLIAIIAMTIDHLAWVFFPGTQTIWYVYALHIIGRLTAPIMWFFIAEGAHYTHDMGRYIGRLFIFAVISHFAFTFAFGIPMIPLSSGLFNQTSVMWSLAWAVVLIALFRIREIPDWAKIALIIIICLITFPADWSSIAVMCPFFLYLHRGNFTAQTRDLVIWAFVYATVYFFFLDKPYAFLQLFICLSIPILATYNGKRGSWKGMQWFFYIYYPAHMVIIGLLRLYLHGNVPIIFS
ncbi:TraX family protein [Alloscardovia theropitheci]|nr:TraX family protein [Alloscardovia theropitheci]